MVDLNNLSENDISKLRQKLGLVETHGHFDVHKAPNLHVEVNSEDILLSGEENTASCANKAHDDSLAPSKPTLVEALFGSNNESDTEDEWGLPKLKSIEKDKPIAQSLASLINTACTSLCDTESLMSKYKIPENCDKLTPPLVNNEVWKVLDKRARSYDRSFVEIQNLVATGMVPVIKLAEILKPYIVCNSEAKQMLSDVLTLMGQIQFNLSLRRRYLIRPNLKKKYISLFGDDVLKEIKNCETGISLAKDKFAYDQRPRGRGSNWRGRGRYRYQPYGRGQSYNSNQSQRGSYTNYIGRGGKSRTATVTSASAPINENF